MSERYKEPPEGFTGHNGYPTFLCETCGAVVASNKCDEHEFWHEQIEKMQRSFYAAQEFLDGAFK